MNANSLNLDIKFDAKSYNKPYIRCTLAVGLQLAVQHVVRQIAS